MNQSNQIIQKEILKKITGIQSFRSGFSGIERILAIKCFEDVANVILRGSGLSASTYKVYLSAVRLLYEFSGGLNPLMIDPALLEAFFDHSVKTTSPVTANVTSCWRRRPPSPFSLRM